MEDICAFHYCHLLKVSEFAPFEAELSPLPLSALTRLDQQMVLGPPVLFSSLLCITRRPLAPPPPAGPRLPRKAVASQKPCF